MRTDEALAREELDRTQRANAQLAFENNGLRKALIKASVHTTDADGNPVLIHSAQQIVEIARTALKGEANG
jgi:hypothetical protein